MNIPQKINPGTDVRTIRPQINGLNEAVRVLEQRVTRVERIRAVRTPDKGIESRWRPIWDRCENTLYCKMGAITVKIGNVTYELYPGNIGDFETNTTAHLPFARDVDGKATVDLSGDPLTPTPTRADVIHWAGVLMMELEDDGSLSALYQTITTTAVTTDTPGWDDYKPDEQIYEIPSPGSSYNSYVFPIGYIDLRSPAASTGGEDEKSIPIEYSHYSSPYWDFGSAILAKPPGSVIPFHWRTGSFGEYNHHIAIVIKAPLYGRTIGADTSSSFVNLLDKEKIVNMSFSGNNIIKVQTLYTDNSSGETSPQSLYDSIPSYIYAIYSYSTTPSEAAGNWGAGDGDFGDAKLYKSSTITEQDTKTTRKFTVAIKYSLIEDQDSPGTVNYFSIQSQHEEDYLCPQNGLLEVINIPTCALCPAPSNVDDPP